MATILNNPSVPATERTTMIERSTDDSGAGWAVAVIILLAVVAIGGFMWMRYYRAPAAAAPTSNGGANINVTLPAAPSQDGTGASGSTGGAAPTPAQ